jgi:hypothetical protein
MRAGHTAQSLEGRRFANLWLSQLPALKRWRAVRVLDARAQFDRFPTVERRSASQHVHCFRLPDLRRVLRLFDTPSDFEAYLRFRELLYAFPIKMPQREADVTGFFYLFLRAPDVHLPDLKRVIRLASRLRPEEPLVMDFAESVFIRRRRQLAHELRLRDRYRDIDELIDRLPDLMALTAPSGRAIRPADEDNFLLSQAFAVGFLLGLPRGIRVKLAKLIQDAQSLTRSIREVVSHWTRLGDTLLYIHCHHTHSDDDDMFFGVRTLAAVHGTHSRSGLGLGYFGSAESSLLRVMWVGQPIDGAGEVGEQWQIMKSTMRGRVDLGDIDPDVGDLAIESALGGKCRCGSGLPFRVCCSLV